MEWYWALGLMLGILVALMATGLPVAFAFFAVNIVGAYVFMNGWVGVGQLVRNGVEAVSSFSLTPIPLFILMGELMLHSRMAERAIDAIDRLIVRLPGRLSLVAVSSGTVFASLSGSTMANTAMLSSNMLPQMRARGYHPTMAMGPILGSGGLAVLIPPSALAVLLGSLARIPIAELLIAGILPALLLAALFAGYVILRCSLNPALAPTHPQPPMSLGARLRPFLLYVLPLLSLFVLVVGSILAGWATPTESAALGAVGTAVVAAGYRRLRLAVVRAALLGTAKITAMSFLIICVSVSFSQILSISGAVDGFLSVAMELQLEPVLLLLLMVAILLALGCVVDQLSMLLLTLPFFMPLAEQANFDLVWYGICLLMVLEISFTTPPFGLLLFVMKGAAPSGTTMGQIYRAAAPFISLELLVLGLVITFPFLATWLPALIAGP